MEAPQAPPASRISPHRRLRWPAGLWLAGLWLALAAGGCTGSDPPEAPCQGEATACSQMTTRCEIQGGCAIGPRCVDASDGCPAPATQAFCTARAECTWAAGCIGVRDPCSLIGAAQECDLNAGCLWSSSSHQCSGIPTPCDEISLERCEIQAGCYLGGTCHRSTGCETFSVTDCTSQSGCVIGEGCAGDVTPCAEFDTTESCGWQVGCTWSP